MPTFKMLLLASDDDGQSNRCGILQLPQDIQKQIIRDCIDCESWFCQIGLINHQFKHTIEQVWKNQSVLNLSYKMFPALLFEKFGKRHLFFQFLIDKIKDTKIGSNIKRLKMNRVLINILEFESLLLLLPNLKHLTLIETPSLFKLRTGTVDEHQQSFLFNQDSFIPQLKLESLCLRNTWFNFNGHPFLRCVCLYLNSVYQLFYITDILNILAQKNLTKRFNK